MTPTPFLLNVMRWREEGDIDDTGLCPHAPVEHVTTYTDFGEELTTCTRCGVRRYTGKLYGEERS